MGIFTVNGKIRRSTDINAWEGDVINEQLWDVGGSQIIKSFVNKEQNLKTEYGTEQGAVVVWPKLERYGIICPC